MDAMWIKVFVLTLSECVAPAGKTACQPQEMEMQFLSRAECEAALVELIALKDQLPNTIVYRERSACAATAREVETFATAAAVQATNPNENWRERAAAGAAAPSAKAYAERLATLSTCEQSQGVTPCKQGDIIVEGTGDGKPVEIWRKDR